jgi:hypothetical protein
MGHAFVASAESPRVISPSTCRRQVEMLGMTILLRNKSCREEPPISKIICHPDRSVAKWRDLLFKRLAHLEQRSQIYACREAGRALRRSTEGWSGSADR